MMTEDWLENAAMLDALHRTAMRESVPASLANWIRKIYAQIPQLPVTLETCDQATDALTEFCMILGVYDIDPDAPQEPTVRLDATTAPAINPHRVAHIVQAAAFWNAFCDDADAGSFPLALLDDAKHMGAGVLEMHYRDKLAAALRQEESSD